MPRSAQRKRREHRFDASRPAANDSRWKITAFGTAGAAILAALLFAPRYWESTQMAPMHADNAPAAAPDVSLRRSLSRRPRLDPRMQQRPPVANVAPAPQEALSAAAEEPRARATKGFTDRARSAREPNRSPRLRPQNYAPITPPTAALAAPAASPPVLASGARSMSADRVSSASLEVAGRTAVVGRGIRGHRASDRAHRSRCGGR